MTKPWLRQSVYLEWMEPEKVRKHLFSTLIFVGKATEFANYGLGGSHS